MGHVLRCVGNKQSFTASDANPLVVHTKQDRMLGVDWG
jgi:hypothetical protein